MQDAMTTFNIDVAEYFITWRRIKGLEARSTNLTLFDINKISSPQWRKGIVQIYVFNLRLNNKWLPQTVTKFIR
jgi:hypothetical protein